MPQSPRPWTALETISQGKDDGLSGGGAEADLAQSAVRPVRGWALDRVSRVWPAPRYCTRALKLNGFSRSGSVRICFGRRIKFADPTAPIARQQRRAGGAGCFSDRICAAASERSSRAPPVTHWGPNSNNGVGLVQCGPFHRARRCIRDRSYDQERQLPQREKQTGWYAPGAEPGSSANESTARWCRTRKCKRPTGLSSRDGRRRRPTGVLAEQCNPLVTLDSVTHFGPNPGQPKPRPASTSRRQSPLAEPMTGLNRGEDKLLQRLCGDTPHEVITKGEKYD